MKDYREPAIRNPRKISGFNIWQSNWWSTYGKGLNIQIEYLNYEYLIYFLFYFKGLNIKDKGSQKLCAEAWNALDSDTRKNYEEEAKNTPNLPVKDSYITNAKSQKTQISNAIHDIRKMVS